MRSILLGLLIPLQGNPASSAAPIHLSPAYRATCHALPAAVQPNTFGVARSGEVLVPVRGGIAIAGWNGWLVEPQRHRVEGITVDPEGSLMLLRSAHSGTGLVVIRQVLQGRTDTLGYLPDGVYRGLADRPGILLVWGRTAAGPWGLWRFAIGKPSRRLLNSADAAIGAAASAGPVAVMVALGPALLLLKAGGQTSRIATLAYPADGLALLADGSVALSGSSGVYRLGPDGRVYAIATGIRGPLVKAGNSFYVLSNGSGCVIQLTHRGT